MFWAGGGRLRASSAGKVEKGLCPGEYGKMQNLKFKMPVLLKYLSNLGLVFIAFYWLCNMLSEKKKEVKNR